MKTHYSILIQWSDEDKCYIASLPEFGEYANTHGKNLDRALQNAKEALGLLTEGAESLPMPQTYNMAHVTTA